MSFVRYMISMIIFALIMDRANLTNNLLLCVGALVLSALYLLTGAIGDLKDAIVNAHKKAGGENDL